MLLWFFPITQMLILLYFQALMVLIFIKKVKGVYVPFFIFLCIEYLICFISRRNELMLKDFFVEFVFQSIGFELENDAYLFNGPIWFLCALFFAEIVFYFVARKNKIYIYTISIVVSLICAYFIDFSLPFGIGYIFAISVFMSIGCIFKHLIKTDRFEMMQKNKVLLVFLLQYFQKQQQIDPHPFQKKAKIFLQIQHFLHYSKFHNL